MRVRSARTSAVGSGKGSVRPWPTKDGGLRTDKLTNGDLLRKRTLRASLVLPAVMHGLTDPKKLGEEKGESSNERGGQPPQSALHAGIGVDTDDGEEDGKASGPYDGVE